MTDKPEALRLADALETELFVWDDNTVDLSNEIAAELRRLHAENEALRTDSERLNWFEARAARGCCDALVFDDNGWWAVSDMGSGPLLEGDEPQDYCQSVFVEKEHCRKTVRDAIDAAIDAAMGEKP